MLVTGFFPDLPVKKFIGRGGLDILSDTGE